MADPSTLLSGLGILLVAAFLLWFAVGTQVNVRKGERTMRWLQGGLPLLGPRTTLRWLGSSVAELTIAKAKPPLRSAVVMVVLEPRDIGALWALARRSGRMDLLIFRVDMQRAPRARADLQDPRAWMSGHRRHDDAPFARQSSWDAGSGTRVRVLEDREGDAAEARAAWARLEGLGQRVSRISIRELVPHLEVHLALPPPGADARQVVSTIVALADVSAAPR